MSDYGLFLSFNNQEEVFRFPVNPERIDVKDSGEGKSYTVAGLGEINAILAPKLTEISFESFFPGRVYPFVHLGSDGELMLPMDYVNTIKGWMETRRPVRFVMTGLVPDPLSGKENMKSFGINMAASIESFNWNTMSGSPEDVEFSITLKRYVFYGARKVVPVKDKPAAVVKTKDRPDDRKKPTSYTVAKGDTLWGIAQKLLGSGSRHAEIQKLNGIKDHEVRKLTIGRVLKIP
ncbi:LysM peptidoglycan-binding domain-containing protein [Paenibacillus sp. JCM 10914]|uniref:LysM peptidoglycan-binding domain-containing protein n=1 Tax=Paenibacillus sp. JCM 10914 TaxID=1236974 RepID=UPI0003CC43C6|nr:LysM peptidoglycan-binding domain-containing protein [Paenibacillus sp. JCM 10914]GAE07278.1 phage-like element PBSX protein xkdP [Paenibacillus sp. JCM 10914]